jgi:hypothetical protein
MPGVVERLAAAERSGALAGSPAVLPNHNAIRVGLDLDRTARRRLGHRARRAGRNFTVVRPKLALTVSAPVPHAIPRPQLALSRDNLDENGERAQNVKRRPVAAI